MYRATQLNVLRSRYALLHINGEITQFSSHCTPGIKKVVPQN